MEEKPLIQWAIAKVIRDARIKVGITQRQLADFSSLSYPFISGVERGNIGVSIAALLQLAEALQVGAPELVERIQRELKNGPTEPAKIHGRPKKS